MRKVRRKDPSVDLEKQTSLPSAAAPRTTVCQDAMSRASVLVTLLLVQSLSSIILDRYKELLTNHVIVSLFLTMLVGAGGNAGNQSTVNAIRGIATGALKNSSAAQFIFREFSTGMILSAVVGFVGFVRILLFGEATWGETFGLVFSLMLIVTASTFLGSLLPFLLQRIGLDPIHGAPGIQVAMDILGVFLTCVMCEACVGVSTGGKSIEHTETL